MNSLRAFRQNLTDVDLIIQRLSNNWHLNINSDLIDGNLIIPDHYRTQTITGDFSMLHLTPFTSPEKSKEVAKPLNPQALFPLSLNIENFQYADHTFGKVNLELQKINDGVRINKLTLDSPLYSLNGQGRWLQKKGKNSSSFSGTLDTDDLGELLIAENITKHLDKGKAKFAFDLSWPDSPLDFQTKDLRGTISANITKGSIIGLDKATNTKIGLGKLINVFSLQSLTKRLTLNFSDIGDSGLEFSEVKGNLVLKNGNIFTDNFYLDGPVAEIYIKGMLGLKKELYNLNIRISPYYTSSLPLIATIAGGPVAGVATWAVSKVARFGVEKVTSNNYKVTGSWKDPKVSKTTS
jgi:uncharacterized protein YhdP